MATNKLAIRTDTAANWTSANPTLVAGEQGHESDTGRRKIGDGSTAWNSLDYIYVPYPVGAQYTMYAVAASDDASVAFPVDERPDALFGGTWEQLWETEGVFFRTEGTSTTDDNDGRSSGLQADQMQRIEGKFRTGAFGKTQFLDGNGVFSSSDGGYPDTSASDAGNEGVRLRFDSGNSTNSRASSTTNGETRPVNRLMRIYRRTA